MEQSRKSVKIINLIWPFADFLYILQLEEYYSKRYLLDLWRFFWRRNVQISGKLELTTRAKLVLLGSILILLVFYLWFFTSFGLSLLLALSLIVSSLLIPIWILIANLALKPLFWLQRKRVLAQAAKLMANRNLKVVAVAGSFGKTTTKLFIKQLLEHSLRVAVTPRTINTPLGIAQWVMTLPDSFDVVVLEMDTYERRDIALSCSIRRPDIAVVTSIGDQHLARIGSRLNLAKFVLEVFDFPDAVKILSASSAEAIKELGLNLPKDVVVVGEELSFQNESVNTNLDSSAALANLKLALKVAEQFDIPKRFVVDTCLNLELPERRQQQITLHGFAVIDNSYNISPTTAKESIASAIKVAQDLRKQLVVITAGIPELGVENSDANLNLGKLLQDLASKTYLLQSIFAPDIAAGFGSSPRLVKIAGRMQTAWEVVLQQCDPQKDLILMLPELNDLYY